MMKSLRLLYTSDTHGYLYPTVCTGTFGLVRGHRLDTNRRVRTQS